MGGSIREAESFMTARLYKHLILLICVMVSLTGFWDPSSMLSAAEHRPQKVVKQPVTQLPVLDRTIPAKGQKVEIKKPAKAALGKAVGGKLKKKKVASKRTPEKARPPQKVVVNPPPPPVVEPKPDLSYGILEQPQRYDPNRDRGTGRVVNPLAGEVLPDHFPELDKNHDGTIDPFERAFSRLDMARDLSNHRRE
jgi:hypothetical protein